MKYIIETYGCQMNKAESLALENRLMSAGWTEAHSKTEADIVILNTCSVRQTAENRIWGRIGEYTALKKQRNFILAVVGCMAENLKETIREKAPSVDYVIGTFEKNLLPESLDEKDVPAARNVNEYHFEASHFVSGDFSAFVPIMHGCNNFCTYCIVPHVRGRETSRPRGSIFLELAHLQNEGVREVTLLGQNVNSYSQPGGTEQFPELLDSIAEKFTGIGWIRFLTSHPKDFSDRLIDVLAKHGSLCNHVHLPVQHGSDRILSAMNRRYTRDHYIGLIEKIRSSIPGVTVSTDILIGFPDETEQDFEDTLELLETVQFDDAFTYKYNIRTGTAAASLPGQLSENEKRRRLEMIIEKQRIISHTIKKKRIGYRKTLLIEQISKKNRNEVLGRTAGNEMVVVPGNPDIIGTFIEAELTSLEGVTFKGEQVQ